MTHNRYNVVVCLVHKESLLFTCASNDTQPIQCCCLSSAQGITAIHVHFEMFTVYLLYIYCIFTVYLLYIYCIFTVYLLYIYCIFTVYLLYVNCIFTVYLLYIYCIFTVYLLYIYCMFTVCLLYINSVNWLKLLSKFIE